MSYHGFSSGFTTPDIGMVYDTILPPSWTYRHWSIFCNQSQNLQTKTAPNLPPAWMAPGTGVRSEGPARGMRNAPAPLMATNVTQHHL
jgi:hypothetical protein